MKKPHISSGGVIYRILPKNKIEVLLLYREKSDSWHLPKGTLENDENLVKAASRETTEETGWKVETEKYLGKLASKKEDKIPKITHYYLMKPLKKVANGDHEHDQVEWIEIKKAKKLLQKFRARKKAEKEKKIIKVAERIIKEKL